MSGITAIFAAKDRVSPTLMKIAGNTSKVNSSMSITESLVKKAIGAFAGLKVAQTGIKALSTGIMNNAEIESATVAWNTLLGSQEKAEKMMKDISGYAAKTPFTKMGVEFMAKQLHNAGFEGEKMFEQMTKIGDIGGAFGIPEDSLKEMVRQYSQVQQATVAYTEDLNILQDRGIPIYKALAKVTGKTVAQVKEMASDAEISSEIYNKAINSIAANTKGAMEDQSKTFNGMWSTFKDTIENISGIVSKPIFDVLKVSLAEVQEKLDAIDWETVGQRVAELTTQGIDVFNNALRWVIDNKEGIQGALKILATAYTIHMGAVLASNAALAIHNVTTGIAIVKDWALSGAIMALYAKDMLLAAGHGVVTAAQWLLNSAIWACPITWVVAAIAGLVLAFVTAYKKSETFRNAVDTLWDKLKSGAKWAVDFAVDKINWLITKANEGIDMLNKIPGVDIGKFQTVGGEKAQTAATGGGGKAWASGTSWHPGGSALVGEAGAELVTGPRYGNLPQGSQVFNAKDTKDIMSSGSGSSNFSLNFNIGVETLDNSRFKGKVKRAMEDIISEELALGV